MVKDSYFCNPLKNVTLGRIILFAGLILFTIQGISQSIGVRAGWNFNKFSGPLEASESFTYSNGIHFGINYGYKFTKKFMIRAEILYNQAGSKQNYDSSGQSYYVIPTPDRELEKVVYEKGKRLLELDISNSYVSLPITAAYQISNKFEIYGGASVNFLVSPTARGRVVFKSSSRPNDILFKQALDHRYYQDVAGGSSTFGSSTDLIRIRVDGKIVFLPKAVGGYYENDYRDGTKYNWFGLSAVSGINYFINKGFYIGGRVEYGLTDITNKKLDFSLEKLNDNFTFIKRDDKDIQITFQASLGFRF